MPRLQVWLAGGLLSGCAIYGANRMIRGPEAIAYEEHRRIVEAKKFLVSSLHRRAEILGRERPKINAENLLLFAKVDELRRDADHVDQANRQIIEAESNGIVADRCTPLRGRSEELSPEQRKKSRVAMLVYRWLVSPLAAAFHDRGAVRGGHMNILTGVGGGNDDVWASIRRLRQTLLGIVATWLLRWLEVKVDVDGLDSALRLVRNGGDRGDFIFVVFTTHWIEELGVWAALRTLRNASAPSSAVAQDDSCHVEVPVVVLDHRSWFASRNIDVHPDAKPASATATAATRDLPVVPTNGVIVPADDPIAQILAPKPPPRRERDADDDGGVYASPLDRLAEDESSRAERRRAALRGRGFTFYPWAVSEKMLAEVSHASTEAELPKLRRKIVPVFFTGAERLVRSDGDRARDRRRLERDEEAARQRDRTLPSSNTIDSGGFDVAAVVIEGRQRTRGDLVEKGRLEREKKQEAVKKERLEAVSGARPDYFDALLARENNSDNVFSNGGKAARNDATKSHLTSSEGDDVAVMDTFQRDSALVYGGATRGGRLTRRAMTVHIGEPSAAVEDVWPKMLRQMVAAATDDVEQNATLVSEARAKRVPLVGLSDPVVRMADVV